jgi:macrodomain Ter protein organizer (MatP/YcbG family)
MPKVSISACLDMDVVNELVAEAKRRGASLSEVLNRILQAISARRRKSRGLGELSQSLKTIKLKTNG